MEEELQELDGLLEGAPRAAIRGERAATGGQTESAQQVLLAGVESRPGGELAVHPGADLHSGQEGIAGEDGRVGDGGEVRAQQVVFAMAQDGSGNGEYGSSGLRCPACVIWD
ncbi:hypothetical protein ACF08O_08040 [Streptomyces paradoxus]|uniref:hypothetical protein n=1 Tax=Streptomyces paradoxus TaxID=66375 RepID=UPI0036F66B82